MDVTQHQIPADIERWLKIVQPSDLHIDEFGFREKRVLETIQQEKPDAILVLGDTVANEGDWGSVGIILNRLHAP